MILASKQFDHHCEHFHRAIGITDAMRTKVRERIFFTAISAALQRIEIFEDPNDAPKELSTVTGDFQRVLQAITDPLEYEYTLMVFNNYQRIAMEAFAMYKAMKDAGEDRETSIKLKIMELVEEIRAQHEKDEEEEDTKADNEENRIDEIDRKTLFKRIGFIKKSNYNFDIYMNMLERWANGGSNPSKHNDIDDMLKNLFSRDDD